MKLISSCGRVIDFWRENIKLLLLIDELYIIPY